MSATPAASPLVPSDLYRLALPGDPELACDGSVYFALATFDEASDEGRSAIWIVRPNRAPRRFTSGANDRSPRVARDGTLAFVGDRGDGKRLYVVAADGGEATPVTPAMEGLAALAWSPGGERLAFVATAPFDAATACIALDERTGARHIRALPFKDDDAGLLDGRRKHLYVVARAGGEPQRLTSGDFDVQAPAWSPDGTQIAFAAQIDIAESAFLADIYVVGFDGAPPRKLTQSRGPANNPAFSHDGAEIAYVAHERGDDVGGRYNLEAFVVPAAGGASRSLSAAADRPVIDYLIGDMRGVGGQQAPVWSADDREVFVPLSTEGACAVAAFARDGTSHRIVAGGERDISSFVRGDDGTLVFAFSTPVVPAEIALAEPDGTERILTACNPWLAERALRPPVRVRPPARDGTVLDLWLLEPSVDDASGPAGAASPAPYVLEVHGGPHTAYGYTFVFEFQMLASHGIGVAYGNPRGSQSYGHAYADAIVGDWGGIDASDVLDLLDAALANANADPARVGLAGGSYGGFMTTLLLGRSDRFAAGVSMRAVNDFVSEVGATDLGWFLESETDAPWTDGGAKLFALSPMRRAHAISVPLLVEHSERDYRCAIDQGEQLFTLLRRLGRRDVEFVRFTGDGHNLSRTGKPRNRVLRLRAIAHWLLRHLHVAGSASAHGAGSLFAPLPAESWTG